MKSKENPFESPAAATPTNTESPKLSRKNTALISLIVTLSIWVVFGFSFLSFSYQILPFIFVLAAGAVGAIPAIRTQKRMWMMVGPIIVGSTLIPLLVLLHTIYETIIYNDWETFPTIIWAPGMILTGAIVGAVFGSSYFIVHLCTLQLIARKFAR